jgi:hypothetical protein
MIKEGGNKELLQQGEFNCVKNQCDQYAPKEVKVGMPLCYNQAIID